MIFDQHLHFVLFWDEIGYFTHIWAILRDLLMSAIFLEAIKHLKALPSWFWTISLDPFHTLITLKYPKTTFRCSARNFSRKISHFRKWWNEGLQSSQVFEIITRKNGLIVRTWNIILSFRKVHYLVITEMDFRFCSAVIMVY